MRFKDKGQLQEISKITVDLHGSLALTGKGHQTDNAVILGLAGFYAESIDTDGLAAFYALLDSKHRLPLAKTAFTVPFNAETDIRYIADPLPLHENGMRFCAWAGKKLLGEAVFYSPGGGFVTEEAEAGTPVLLPVTVPFPFENASQLLELCQQHELNIAEILIQNELACRTAGELKTHIHNIWAVTQDAVRRGLSNETVLPGPLRIPRRAPSLHRILLSQQVQKNDPLTAMDWLNLYALAVSEENAAGGRVVTAPTNGACGIMPAVINWYHQFVKPVNDDILTTWYMTATAIGSLFKRNASISGAEVGCQGEVGVACSMAAAGLAALMNGSPKQVCSAAEIAMEHNLGLTCDPVAGQVQVPCIERNAVAAVKAVNAARMALQRTSAPHVSLDVIIETMYRTGKDMPAGYRETSQAGLAVTVKV